MVTNGVTNLPMDGYPKVESSKTPQVANQFANALEPAPVLEPQVAEKPAQASVPSGISSLYNDAPNNTQTFSDKAHQVWSFAREVVGGFGKPSGVPDDTIPTKEVSVIDGNSRQLVNGERPLLETQTVKPNQPFNVLPPGQKTVAGTLDTKTEDTDIENGPNGNLNGVLSTPGKKPSLAEKYYGKGKGPTDEPDVEEPTPVVKPQQNSVKELPPPPPPPPPPVVIENNNNNNNGGFVPNNGNGNGNGPVVFSNVNNFGPGAPLQYDPMTGQPLNPQPQQFVPNTGLPLINGQPQQFDPVTGLPLAVPPQPQFDPATGMLLTAQPSQLQTLFSQVDLFANLPPILNYNNGYSGGDFNNFQLPTLGMNMPSMFNLPQFPPLPNGGGGSMSWSQGLYGDILGSYFGGIIPPGGASSTAGLQFAPGF